MFSRSPVFSTLHPTTGSVWGAANMGPLCCLVERRSHQPHPESWGKQESDVQSPGAKSPHSKSSLICQRAPAL